MYIYIYIYIYISKGHLPYRWSFLLQSITARQKKTHCASYVTVTHNLTLIVCVGTRLSNSIDVTCSIRQGSLWIALPHNDVTCSIRQGGVPSELPQNANTLFTQSYCAQLYTDRKCGTVCLLLIYNLSTDVNVTL